MRLAAALLLLLAAYGGFLRGHAINRRLAALLGDGSRYRLWIVKPVLLFALPALAALALVGRLEALRGFPRELQPLADWLGDGLAIDADFLTGVAIGGAIVLLAALLLRGRGFRLGKVGALLPRHRGELVPAALLSLSAGVTEELFFRLALPLLIAQASGSSVAGMAAGIVLFGVAHRYQGWVGVAATTALGGLFAWFYVATGRIEAAIALHVLVDLVALVLRPALGGAWRAENPVR